MVPASVASVAIFVALLAPGFVYLQRREAWHPGVRYTVLRETSLVVTTSLLSIALASAVIAFVIVFSPLGAPDVGPFVRGGGDYARQHYREVILWLAVLLGGSCLIAAWIAIPPKPVVAVFRFICIGPLRRYGGAIEKRRGDNPIQHASAWWKLANAYPEHDTYLDITLANGTWITGKLWSMNPDTDETNDRDLILSKPLAVQSPGLPLQELEAAAMCVHAGDIAFFTVRYVRRSPHRSTIPPDNG